MTKNKEATRYYSSMHEQSIAKALGAVVNSSSGSSCFCKGDVIHDGASMLIEAKCCMKPKDSVSIKKEWIEKNIKESFLMRKSNQAICINFEPEGDNYYIINERLMKFLIQQLEVYNGENS